MDWRIKCETFLRALRTSNSFCSSHNKSRPSLYAEIYCFLTRYYLDGDLENHFRLDEVLACQDQSTGRFVGPELLNWTANKQALQDQTESDFRCASRAAQALALRALTAS